jgi:CRP/FNR family cyclic AMP-dependent transcriptional regulator
VPGLFELLPSEAWQALLRKGRVRTHPRGDVLLRQGDDGVHVLLLTAGRVKVTRIERDGRELLLAVRGPGEALGELSAWDGSKRSATVTAVAPSTTYIVSARHFRQTMEEYGAADLALRHVLARLREGEDIRAELVEPSAALRVIRILVRLGSALAGDADGPLTLHLGLSQEELARAVGLSRSAFAAELAALRTRGFVSTGRQRVVIHDLQGLRDVAEEPPELASNG